jgi:hypothetical protein
VAAKLTNQRVSEAEAFAFIGEAPGSEIDQLAAPGLSGEAWRRVACFDDQFGQKTTITLTRGAQNGLLLTRSIVQMHKGPENGLRKMLIADEPVTPDGAAEDADFCY